jgi:molybdopterin adenylyltransferase
MMPGQGELLREVSLRVIPTAILSRQLAGVRGASPIIDFPGKPSAIVDCLNAVFTATPSCVELNGGP